MPYLVDPRTVIRARGYFGWVALLQVQVPPSGFLALGRNDYSGTYGK